MFQIVSSKMDLGIFSVNCIKCKHILSNIGRELHLLVPVLLPPISLVYEA